MDSGKDVPSLSSIQVRMQHLFFILRFHYNAFRENHYWTAKEKVHTFLHQQAREGKLIQGVYRERTWFGFPAVRHIVKMWLTRALMEGCHSWDRVWMYTCVVVLQMATFARIGDITKSDFYPENYTLTWKDVNMFVQQVPNPTVENIELVLVLRFTKGNKDIKGKDHKVYLRPLAREHNFVCAVKVLLTLAMRYGQLADDLTLPEVLAQTSQRPGRQTRWKYPDRPVLCLISRSGEPELDRPFPCHFNWDLQNMARAGGVLGKVTTHSIRRGAARGYAHALENARGSIVAEHEVASALGHSYGSLFVGETATYIGDRDVDMYTPRATSTHNDSRAPILASQGFTMSVSSPAEIDGYMRDHDMDPENQSQRVIARREMKESKVAAWEEAIMDGAIGSSALRIRGTPASPIGTGVIWTLNDVESEGDVEQGDFMIDASEQHNANEDDDATSIHGIEDLEAVDCNELEQTREIPEINNLLTGEPNEFINFFSNIHVRRVERPNDVPDSRWKYYCGTCSYSTYTAVLLRNHLPVCRGDKERTFPCPREGCGKILGTKSSLQSHISKVHDYQPRPCLSCIDFDDTIYNSHEELVRHRERDHGKFDEPRRCPLAEECDPTRLWDNYNNLRVHIRRKHGRTTSEATDLIGRKQRTSEFRCPIEGCDVSGFSSTGQLRDHVKKSHKTSDSDAQKLVPQSVMEKYAQSDVSRKRGGKAKGNKTGPMPRRCPFADCKTKLGPHATSSDRRVHLVQRHQLTEAEAERLVPLTEMEQKRRQFQ